MERPVRLVAFANEPIHYRTSLYRRIAGFGDLDLQVIYASTGGSYFPRVEVDRNNRRFPISIDGVDSWFVSRAATNASKPSFMAFKDPDILQMLDSLAPDVLWLHGYNSLTHQLAAYYQRARRKPLLLREEMTLLGQRPLWKTLAKHVGLRSMLRNAHGLYIGSENKKWFAHYGVPEERLHFTPYAVENHSFQKAALHLRTQRQAIRAGFGIHDPSVPVVCTVCRLVPKKNVALLIDAFAKVRSRSRCALLIVGSGPLELELHRQVAASRISDVHFAGHIPQSDIANAYVAADIFVLSSSHDETWGLVVNEAMNFELPIVVSTQVGSGADLVQHFRNGYKFEPTDVGALAGILQRLVDSPELRRSLGQASRSIVSNWSHEVAAESIAKATLSATRGRDRYV